MGKLIVKSNKNTGSVITPSENNADWGSIMISEETFVVNGGIINRQSRNAFFRAELTTLNAMSLKDGQEFPIDGKLVHHEATTPFYVGQDPKKAGKDGGVLLFNGMPIYRETVFTSDPAETDLLVKHTSVAAVAPVKGAKKQPLNS